MKNLLTTLTYLISLFAYSQNTCVDRIPITYNAKVQILDSLPVNVDTLANRNGTILILRDKVEVNWSDAVFIVSKVKEKWCKWEICDFSSDYFKAEIQLLTINGVSEPLIYVKWSDLSMGSGMGESMVKKELWSMNGERSYFNMYARVTNIYKDKYGPDATFKIFNTHYYCVTTISKTGIEIKENNTCGNKFAGIESGKQMCHDMVGKYVPGMYIYQKGQWKRQ